MLAFIKALISLIVVRNISYYIVKWTEFQVLCQVLNKACKDKVLIAYLTIFKYVKVA